MKKKIENLSLSLSFLFLGIVLIGSTSINEEEAYIPGCYVCTAVNCDGAAGSQVGASHCVVWELGPIEFCELSGFPCGDLPIEN